MQRKPHPRSVLKTLSDDDQAALFAFMQEDKKRTLADGVGWLFSNNGIRTNDSSLSEWLGWYEMNRTIDGYLSDVDELKEKLASIGTDPDLIPKIGEAVFLGKAAKTGDVKMFATVASITQRHTELKASQAQHGDKMQLEGRKLVQKDTALKQAEKKICQQERRITALEAQAAAAKKIAEKTKDALKDGAMDDETRAKIMQEMDRMILGKTPAKPKTT